MSVQCRLLQPQVICGGWGMFTQVVGLSWTMVVVCCVPYEEHSAGLLIPCSCSEHLAVQTAVPSCSCSALTIHCRNSVRYSASFAVPAEHPLQYLLDSGVGATCAPCLARQLQPA
jgi:hypothetical protein